MNKKECRILFENGTELIGRSLGHIGTAGGEVCFNTAQ
jgi:carbamoylphosphate synthase small subunit